MNHDLKQYFSRIYNDADAWTSPEGYFTTVDNLIVLFKKHNISTVFDAGCGPMHWMNPKKLKDNGIHYTGGDIVPYNVEHDNGTWPDFDIKLHDMTTDPLPKVDCVFSSDVVIHLTNQDKRKFLDNFLASGADYLLVTHSGDSTFENIEVDYNDAYPFAEVNWNIGPWNFPPPLDKLIYNPPVWQKYMCLWTAQQISLALT